MTQPGKRKNSDHELDLIGLRLSVGWNTVLLPFEQSKFISLLPSEGYVLTADFRQLAASGGASVEASGAIGRKGNTILFVDTGKLTLGIEAADARSMLDEFDRMEDLLRERLSFDSGASARFYELIAHILVWTDRSAIDTLRSLNLSGELVQPIADILGEGQISDVSLRLTPSDGTPLGPDWWDIHIEPSWRSPDRCFRCDVVYRRSNGQAVRKFAQDLERRVEEIFRFLEHRVG